MKQRTIRTTDRLWREIKTAAKRKGWTTSDFIRLAVEKQLRVEEQAEKERP